MRFPVPIDTIGGNVREIINNLKELFTGKFALYSIFSILIVTFMLYHRNFFTPPQFWMFYSFMLMFAAPSYFIMLMEHRGTERVISGIVLILVLSAVIPCMYIRTMRFFFSKWPAVLISAGIALIPMIAVSIKNRKFVLADFGFSKGDIRLSLIITGVSIAVMVPIVIIASRFADFRQVYPLFKPMARGGMTFVLYEFYFLVFFVFWEYLFRGFMLFSMSKHSGLVYAVLMQAAIFTFAHLGKPEIETVSSLFGGLFLGIIIYRVRSFLPAAIIHFVIALTMDIIAVFF